MHDALIRDIDHHGDGDSCAGANDDVMARNDDRRVGCLIEEAQGRPVSSIVFRSILRSTWVAVVMLLTSWSAHFMVGVESLLVVRGAQLRQSDI